MYQKSNPTLEMLQWKYVALISFVLPFLVNGITLETIPKAKDEGVKDKVPVIDLTLPKSNEDKLSNKEDVQTLVINEKANDNKTIKNEIVVNKKKQLEDSHKEDDDLGGPVLRGFYVILGFSLIIVIYFITKWFR